MEAPQLYRGLAKSVEGAKTIPEILDVTGLNWQTEAVPVEYTHCGVTRKMEHDRVMVRSDNGAALATVSDRFKIHQNEQVIGGLAKLAEAGNIKITHGGPLEGGAVVFLHGHINREFDVLDTPREEKGHVYDPGNGAAARDLDAKKRYKVNDSRKIGDIVRLDFSLRSGHRPGTPTVGQAIAMRLACYNGATSVDQKSMFRLSHLQDWKNANQTEMMQFVENMVKQFETYEQKARRLLGYKMTREQSQMYVLELLQPEVLRLAVEQTAPVLTVAARSSGSPVVMTGAQVIEELMNRQEHEDVVGKLLAGHFGKRGDDRFDIDRSTKQAIHSLENQPGYEMALGTAWNAVNGITYWVDHVRGRNDDHCVQASLTGNGAKLKSRALDLAIEYTERQLN